MYEQLFPHLNTYCALDQVSSSDGVLRLCVHARQSSAVCPSCGQPSTRVHSHYRRRLWDLPGSGRPVQVLLVVRRFRCSTPGCPRTTFAEALPGLTQRYGRRTLPQQAQLHGLALALGGRPAAAQAAQLGLAAASASTLLRLLHRVPQPRQPAVRVLGIDDWAWRKGRRYGTILVDLVRHQAVELLEEYSAAAIAAWLRQHRSVVVSSVRPICSMQAAIAAWLRQHRSVRIIVRDRSPVGRQACQQGAPQARQVADRFHLLLNLTDQLAKGFAHHPKPHSRSPTGSEPSRPEEALCPPLPQKAACFAHMQHLRAQGWSHRAIAQVVGVSYKTVERWLRHGAPPASGGTIVLHHRQRGQASKPAPLGPRQAAWLFVQAAEDLRQQERQRLEQLLELRPELMPLYQLAQRFVRLVVERDSQALLPWLQDAQHAWWSEVRQLARGLLRDYAAVQAALELPYSNGPVEGQVTRLKLLKRQMYGRAKLPLLRTRFLRRA